VKELLTRTRIKRARWQLNSLDPDHMQINAACAGRLPAALCRRLDPGQRTSGRFVV